MRTTSPITLLTFLALASTSPAQERFLCMDAFSGSLLELDPTSAATMAVGAPAAAHVHSLAREPGTNWLYGVEVTFPNFLIRVHPETGTAQTVAQLDLSLITDGLAFLPDGRLVAAITAVPYGPSTLYEVDHSTAATTMIGPMDIDSVSALDVDPTTGFLWASVASNDPSGALAIVDPLTGTAAPVATTRRLTTIAFDASGALFGIDNMRSNYLFSRLYAIDTATGNAQLIGETTERSIQGLVVVPPPEVSSYCTGAPNSTGAGATLGWSGSASVFHNDFVLSATGCPPNRFGLVYYGSSAAQVPLGDGLRCVGLPFHRLPIVMTDSSGNVSHPLDLSSPPTPGAQIRVGDAVHFQLWYRDPAGPGGTGSNLSDGLRVRFRV